MKRNIVDNEKREEIIDIASELFFERGYDATSVRMIQKKVGREGLFYYYFRGKEEVFEKVLDRFFCYHKEKVQEIVDNGKRDPFRLIYNFFDYIKKETDNFIENYLKKMNKRINLEIRIRALRYIEYYLKKIINILVGYGAKLKVDLDVAVITLANGIGKVILYRKNFNLKARNIDLKTYINMITGFCFENAELMFSFFAQKSDVKSIMTLACSVKDEIGEFDNDIFEQIVFDKILKQEIIVIREGQKVVGVLAFSRENFELEFLATSKKYRRFGIATRLIVTAMAQYDLGMEVSVVTYLQDDDIGKEALGLYRKFGFQNCGDVVKFGQKRQLMKVVVGDFFKEGLF